MAVKTQGTNLYFIDPDSDTVKDVGCVTQIDGIDSSRDQIETTCLTSNDRQYVAGLGTPGTASFTINVDPTNPVHVRMYELKQRGDVLHWALGWGDGDIDSDGLVSMDPPNGVATDGGFDLPNTRSWLEFDGYLSSFPFSFALNSVVTSAVGIQISGEQVLTAKS